MIHRPVKAFLSFPQQKHWFSLSSPLISTVNPLVPLSWELELGLLPMKAARPPSGSARPSPSDNSEMVSALGVSARCSGDRWLVTNAHPAGCGNNAGCETWVLLIIPPVVRCICEGLRCKVAACMSDGRTGGQMVCLRTLTYLHVNADADELSEVERWHGAASPCSVGAS